MKSVGRKFAEVATKMLATRQARSDSNVYETLLNVYETL